MIESVGFNLSVGVGDLSLVFMQSILDPAVSWIFIPLFALSIPIIGILVKPFTARLQFKEKEEARKLYERIVMEKLDLMKTAIAMGYSVNDLSDLDARLEKLVGTKKLRSLLDPKDPKTPVPEEGLLDLDLESEVNRLNQGKSKETV